MPCQLTNKKARTLAGFFNGVIQNDIGGFKYELQHGLTRRETPRGVS